MDISVITELIQNVGFPIFIAIYVLHDSKNRELRSNEAYKELSTTLSKNTEVLTKLYERTLNE